MSRLFLRSAVLTIAEPATRVGFFGATLPNATVITDLRVTFNIVKSLEQEPNECELSVYNLAEQTRARFQKLPLQVRLDVGHDGEAARVFTGDVKWARSARGPVEWETKMQLGDGERAYRHARVNRSYRAGVTGKDALREVAGSMGLRIPKNIEDAKELAGQFASGLSLQGPSQREMTRILKAKGMGWSIQDGALQVLRSGDARAGQAILVSQDTGLIGVPEYAPPKEPGKPPRLTFTMLIYPGIVPGGLIQMQTAAIKGVFKVVRVVHAGDTHGEAWYSTVEAEPR